MIRPLLAVVVPCFDEEAVFAETRGRLEALLRRLASAGTIDPGSRIWFVDDGSRDRTWALIEAACAESDSLVCGLKLSRNHGHQAALLAGLMSVPADVTISIDADLQDDPAAIAQMLERHAEGADIVFGVRRSRSRDTPFKRLSAETYYRLLRRMGVEIVVDHADYRLMTRRAVEALRGFVESNLFLRGLVPLLGFSTARVEYERDDRFAGQSKYPLRRMISLAWQGITSFSAVPLRVITGMGVLVSVASIGMGGWALSVRLFTDDAVPGWASIVIPQFLLSGVQLLSLGVIGEYLAKVYLETKRRPRFIVERSLRPPRDRSPEG